MSEGITIEFTDAASRRRRYRFEARSAGGYTRHEEEFDGDSWRPVGREIVADVVIEASSDLVAGVS